MRIPGRGSVQQPGRLPGLLGQPQAPLHLRSYGETVSAQQQVGAWAPRDQHLALPPERLPQQSRGLLVGRQEHVPLLVAVVHLAVDEVLDQAVTPPGLDAERLERMRAEGPRATAGPPPLDPRTEVLVVGHQARGRQLVVPLAAAAQDSRRPRRQDDRPVGRAPHTPHLGPVQGQPSVQGQLVAGSGSADRRAQQHGLADRVVEGAVPGALPVHVHPPPLVVAKRWREHEHGAPVGPLAHLHVQVLAGQAVGGGLSELRAEGDRRTLDGQRVDARRRRPRVD